METSLILLKPDCVAGRMVGEVIKRFEDEGFQIRGCKMFSASPDLLKEHYSHLLDKSFFPELEVFMQSTPVIALALTGPDAVSGCARSSVQRTREKPTREPFAATSVRM